MSDHTADQNTLRGVAPGWRDVPLARIPRGTDGGGRVGGVVAGVSRAYGFDLRTTRIAVVIATLVLPVMILAYIAAWVLLPQEPAPAQSLSQVVRDRRRLPVLLAIALVLVVGGLGSLGSWFLFRGAPWGLVLVAIGVLLWVSTSINRRMPAPTDLAGPSGGATTPDGAAMPLVAAPDGAPDHAGYAAGPVGTSAAIVEAPVAGSAVIRRRRAPIGIVSLIVALLFAGLASVLEAAGAWNAPALWVIVAALGIVMAGLAVSAAVNRSWLVLLPLLVLSPAVLMLSIAQPHLDGGAGQRTLLPTTVDAAERFEQLGTGQLEIDLRSLPAGADTVSVRARVGIGRLHVIVPADVTVQLTTDLGAGSVQVDDRELTNGIRETDTRLVEPLSGTSTRTFVLDLTMGMGQIDVDRAG